MTFSGWPNAKLASPPVPTCPVSVDAVAYPRRSAPASVRYEIVPAHPPLPTAWSLPFQTDAGSHTSILMSESLDGVNVAATRQNAGRSRKACAAAAGEAAPPTRAGGVNAPASTTCASVIVVFSSVRDAKLSHDVAAVNV